MRNDRIERRQRDRRLFLQLGMARRQLGELAIIGRRVFRGLWQRRQGDGFNAFHGGGYASQRTGQSFFGHRARLPRATTAASKMARCG